MLGTCQVWPSSLSNGRWLFAYVLDYSRGQKVYLSTSKNKKLTVYTSTYK